MSEWENMGNALDLDMGDCTRRVVCGGSDIFVKIENGMLLMAVDEGNEVVEIIPVPFGVKRA